MARAIFELEGEHDDNTDVHHEQFHKFQLKYQVRALHRRTLYIKVICCVMIF
jgi:hypothetical protein